MELARRDRRHLTGQAPKSEAPSPPAAGHIVGSGWRGDHAALWLRADAPGAVRLPLVAGGRIDLDVLPERRCTGRSGPDGWEPCPRHAPVGASDPCYVCLPAEDRRCVFGASEDDCGHPGCAAPHFVYVAFHGPLAKVGLSLAARGEGRLVEQGADAFFIAAHAETRAAARRTEVRLSTLLDIPEARRASEILPWTARPVPWDAVEGRYDTLAAQCAGVLGATPGPLRRIAWSDDLPLPLVPVMAGIVGHHRGTIVATKGRFLFYRDDAHGTLWALPIGALVAHAARYQPGDAEPDDVPRPERDVARAADRTDERTAPV